MDREDLEDPCLHREKIIYIYTDTQTHTQTHTHTHTHTYIYIYIYICKLAIGLMGRVFANDPGDEGIIPSRDIPKTPKWYLILPCLKLNIIRYGPRVKSSYSRNGIAPSHIPRCCRNIKVALGLPWLQTSTLLIYIYIYILPRSGHVDTTVWMHHLDANKTVREEARRQLHKNGASNIIQVLAATPHKTPTIRPPASHHENYPS